MASPPPSNPSTSITTARLFLRPLAPTDSDAVFLIRSAPGVLYWTTPDTREKSDLWMKTHLEDPKCMTYTVALLPSFHPPPSSTIPTTHVHEQDSLPQIIGLTGAHSLPEIGYIFHPSAWKQGYATEALKAWVDMYWSIHPEGHPLLEEGEKEYLKARTGPGGEGSRGVLRKCGFKWHGEEEVVDERLGGKEEDGRVRLSEWRIWRDGEAG